MSDLAKEVMALKKLIAEQGDTMHALQKRVIENELMNIEQALGAKDTFVSIGDTKFLMWEYTINSAKKEINAIATNRGSKSGHGFSKNQKLLDIQRQAIERGIQVNRIFCVDEDQYEDFAFMELMRSQLEIGVDVYVAQQNVAEFLTSEHEYDQENYVIADDTVLYRSYVEAGISKNSVSFDVEAVKRYRTMHAKLTKHAHKFTSEDLPKGFTDL